MYRNFPGPGEKIQQKVVVGDKDGVIQVNADIFGSCSYTVKSDGTELHSATAQRCLAKFANATSKNH